MRASWAISASRSTTPGSASAFILAQVVGLSIAGAWRESIGLETPIPALVAAFGLGFAPVRAGPVDARAVIARAFQGLAGGGLNALGFAAAAAYPEASGCGC